MASKPRPQDHCRYCGRDMYVSHIPIHEKQCLYGPMGEKVKAFLRESAIGGQLVSSNEYERTKPAGYPGRVAAQRQIGDWFDVAAWVGLDYTPTPQAMWRYDGTKATPEFVPDVEFIVEDEAIEEYPLLPGKETVKHLYNWRTRSYEPVVCYELR